MHVGFGSLNTFSGSYRSNAALADSPPLRRAATVLSAQELVAAASSKSAAPSPEVEALRSDVQAETASFASDAGNFLQRGGISLPPEVMMSIGSDGRISVVDSRADAARIAQQFENAPDLQARFSALSSKAGALRAADSNPEFSAAYQQLAGKPAAQQALADSQSAQAGKIQFHLVLTPQGPEVFFAGAGVAKV